MPKNTKTKNTTFSVSSIGPDKDYNIVKQIHLNAQPTGKHLPHKVAVIERDTGRVKMFFDSRDARKYRDEVGGNIYYPGSGPEVSDRTHGAAPESILKFDLTHQDVPSVDLYQAQNKYKHPSPIKFDFHDMYDNIMVPRPALTLGASQYKTQHKGNFPRNAA